MGHDPAKQSLFIDRRNAGHDDVPGFAVLSEAPLLPAPGACVSLRILVDRCSVEVFAADGVVTASAYVPSFSCTRDPAFVVDGVPVIIRQLRVRGMAAS